MPSWGIIPDKPGWYWVRSGRNYPNPVPMKVFRSKAGGMLCCILLEGAIMAQGFHRYEWAGPIEEPGE